MTPPPSLPNCGAELHRIADLVCRGYGMNVHSARLLVLQSLGAMAARTLTVRSLDGVDCTPGFDLIIIGEGQALVHGAQIAVLDPIFREFQAAMAREESHGREHARFQHDALKTKLEALQPRIRSMEAELAVLTVPCDYGKLSESDYLLHAAGAPERPQRRKDLSSSLASLRAESLALQQRLVDWRFASSPGIVRDGGGWMGFPGAGKDSFDGCFLQLGSASSLTEELESLPSAWFGASAELFQRSRKPSPFARLARCSETTAASVQLAGDHFAVSRMLQDPRLARSGFFKGFVLCATDGAPNDCDPEAMAQLAADDLWMDALTLALTHRLCDYRQTLRLDRAGILCCLEFKNWLWGFRADLPEAHQWSFTDWTDLMVRLASSLARLEEPPVDGILEVRYLDAASAMLREHAPRQATLLDTLLAPAQASGAFDPQVDKIVQRLVDRGPMTKRDLARTTNGQDYRVIDALLRQGMARGLILQSGRHFLASDVSVSASAGRVVDFREGVAA